MRMDTETTLNKISTMLISLSAPVIYIVNKIIKYTKYAYSVMHENIYNIYSLLN